MANLLKEEIPQLYVMCGRGARSTLRVLRPGLAATEIAVSPLPGNPTAVWTLKRSTNDSFDAYIIVSFTNATLVRCRLNSALVSFSELYSFACRLDWICIRALSHQKELHLLCAWCSAGALYRRDSGGGQ